MDGWISLHRKIRKNPIFHDHELLRLWLICLTEAYFKETDQPVGRQVVHLMPGEFITGRFELADMYNEGLKRDQQKSPKTIWRWLESLENGEFLTIKSTNKYSVVTLVNWEKYQSNDQQNDQQTTNKRPTDDQQVTTKNKVNKDKKDNKDNKKHYADFVTLTESEYEKLIEQYGEEMTQESIGILNAYKASSGRKYRSDYHTMLPSGWVHQRIQENRNKVRQFPQRQQHGSKKPQIAVSEGTTAPNLSPEQMEHYRSLARKLQSSKGAPDG